MISQEYLKDVTDRMKRLVDNQNSGKEYDEEHDHDVADKILMEVCKSEGYTELVDLFDKLKKWYS